MSEIDNCPVCNTTCELEFGLEEGAGAEYEREISYATCKTCKTRWRRRDDPVVAGRMIYEKWSCRIPETTINVPIIGWNVKLRPIWCRWVKVKEKQLPVETLSGEVSKGKQIVANETLSIKKKEFQQYIVRLKRGETLRGEIHSDAPINIYFMDESNFGKYIGDKRFYPEDGKDDFWEGSIEYSAPRKDVWFLVLENEGKESVKVKVYLYV
jgi:hypothetical protein